MAGPSSQQDKMAVLNSVDQKTETTAKSENAWEEINQGLGKPMTRNRSFENQSKKKSSFQITRVIDRGIFHATEDGDSVDDLDDTCETRTEDVSSDILDLSKNTDIEADPSSSEETTPSFMTEEVAHKDLTTAKQNIASQELNKLNATTAAGTADMQSRFKVVKIESKEPFRRGRWTCLDYSEPPNVSEKAVDRTEEEGSGNSSASSSIHYVEQEHDIGATMTPVENILVIDPTIYPANSHNKLQNGVEYSTQYTPVPQSSTLVQPGGGAPQTLSQVQEPPISQSFEIGASLPTPQQVLANQPLNTMPSNVSPQQNVTTTIPQSVGSLPTVSQALPSADYQSLSSAAPSQTVMNAGYENSHVSSSDVPAGEPTQVNQAASSMAQPQQNVLEYQSGIGAASSTNSPSDTLQGLPSNTEVTGQSDDMFVPPHEDVRPESSGQECSASEVAGEAEGAVGGTAKPSVLTSSALTNPSFLSPPLLEMVSATAQQVSTSKDDGEGERSLLNVFSGASTVAIDNKIEQAMDLVKSHLMFAVREEVEVLKEQIKELLEKNSQLEYEINILKANASPETLQKLAQVSQSNQQPPTSSS